MQDRILNIVNAVLLLICGFCVWVLVTKQYDQPAEIREALAQIKDESDYIAPAKGVESKFLATPPPLPPAYASLNKEFMKTIFTPTPTPTPPPTPTPAPPNLKEAVQLWVIQGLNPGSVDILNQRDSSTFNMKVGETKDTLDQHGQAIHVKLEAVDLQNLKATFTYAGQKEVKDY